MFRLVRAALAATLALLPYPAFAFDLTGYTLTFDEAFWGPLSISDSKTNDGSRWYSKVIQCCLMPTDKLGSRMNGIHDDPNPFSMAAGGRLDIRLQKTAAGWSSGVLATVDAHGVGFAQEYGYFVMRAKFPAGQVTWPAFWLLDQASKAGTPGALHGEIDVVEFTNKGVSSFSSTLHDWSANKVVAVDVHKTRSFPADGSWHTYAMLWRPDVMTFFYDDRVVWTTPTPSVMHQPYFLIVDLGMGAGWPTAGLTPDVSDLLIDYVRAYKLPGT